MPEPLLAGSLASNLAVATTFALLFGVATALPPRPNSIRWSAAGVPVVGLRLTLVALLLVGSWGIFDTRLLVSWLEWFAAVATALVTGWLLLLPLPHLRWDSWLLAINTVLVVGLTVSVGIEQLAGASWPIGLWGGFGLLVALSLIVLLSVRRISNWPVLGLAYAALAVGFGADGFFGTGLLRIAEAVVYPAVSLLIIRGMIQGGVQQAELRLKRIGGSSRRSPSAEPPEQVQTLKAELRLALEELAEVSSATERQEPIPVGSLTAFVEGMRDPLASIQGYSQMLAGGGIGELGADQRKFVDRINDSASRVLDQLNGLLSLVRGSDAPIDSQADVITCMETAVAQVAGSLKERDQSLHLDLAESLPAVGGDPDELRQIMVTMIEYAIQASPAGSVIPVSALATDSADGAWVSLSVSDSGGGIPPEELGRVFHIPEPGRGAETGLARVKQLAEGMGGRVWIGSEVGGGSTVTVLIPARAE